MTLSPPRHIAFVLSRLHRQGFQAWCVGGCVRDALLGRAPADWDIATSALPQQVLAAFPGCGASLAGAAHGTVTLLLPGGSAEITTFRVDGDYENHRKPRQVLFTPSLAQDLARRDFTVNAMAYCPGLGLFDPFSGLADLENRVLRCVGQPALRFDQDALRILRCLRFAAVLGFTIDPLTRQGARQSRGLLPGLSGQRVQEELTRLLPGPWAARVLWEEQEILFAALPELAPLAGCGQESLYHRYDCWGHSLCALHHAPPLPVLRWAALLHDCGKPLVKSIDQNGIAHFYNHGQAGAQAAGRLLRRLGFPSFLLQEITRLVEHHSQPLPIGEKRIRSLFAQWGPQGLFRLLDLVQAHTQALAEEPARRLLPLVLGAKALAREIGNQAGCLSPRDLALNGRDLLSLGYSPGPQLGAALKRLFELVLAGKLENRRPALLQAARAWQKPAPP